MRTGTHRRLCKRRPLSPFIWCQLMPPWSFLKEQDLCSSFGKVLPLLDSHQIFDDCPIEYMIMIESLAYEKRAEDFAQVGILRFVFKATRTDIIEISCKFPRKTLAQIFRTDRLLLRQDKLFLLLLVCGCKTLPRETASEEVDEHVS